MRLVFFLKKKTIFVFFNREYVIHKNEINIFFIFQKLFSFFFNKKYVKNKIKLMHMNRKKKISLFF